jgi:bifunctional DNA-binding transcriptional regulator/antitoxin component of YhaV-PrlF toxin-antitoxin module
MNYTLEIQEDSNGDYFIEFPTEIVEALGWAEGDILEWKLKAQGVILSKLNDPTMEGHLICKRFKRSGYLLYKFS